jgi:hypothetical protein
MPRRAIRRLAGMTSICRVATADGWRGRVDEWTQPDHCRIRGTSQPGGRAARFSPPRPAPAPHGAVLAVPADARREHARLHRGEDLRGQAVEPDVGRAVAGRPGLVGWTRSTMTKTLLAGVWQCGSCGDRAGLTPPPPDASFWPCRSRCIFWAGRDHVKLRNTRWMLCSPGSCRCPPLSTSFPISSAVGAHDARKRPSHLATSAHAAGSSP